MLQLPAIRQNQMWTHFQIFIEAEIIGFFDKTNHLN